MLNKEIVNKIILSFSLIALPACAYYLGANKSTLTEITDNIQSGSVEYKEEYYYEVVGAVGSPGVFKNTDPILIEQAIKDAGGFTNEADMNYVYKNIKLAVTVIPGEKIYIPHKGNESSIIKSQSDEINGKINLNFATFAELDAIDGVGEVTANRIISARPFRSCDDIDKIEGIKSNVKKTIKGKCII